MASTTPHSAPVKPHEVIIIGAGFGGIGLAARLLRAGVSDLLVLEKSPDVGGVWQANRYPGAACDVPSHLYSFSFAPNPHWSRRFAPQAEILRYLQECRAHAGAKTLRYGKCRWPVARHCVAGCW